MGEAKAKKSQAFRISVPGRQRNVLFQAYQAIGSKDADREKRRALRRTHEAFGLDDFEGLRAEVADGGGDPVAQARANRASADAFDAKIEGMELTVTVTREAIDTAGWVIDQAMKAGAFTGRGIVLADDLEELLEACKDGKHAVSLETAEPVAAPNGEAKTEEAAAS